MLSEKDLVIQKCKIIYEILSSLPEYDYKTSKSELPINGIYFFYEDGEFCEDRNGRQKRIVRVGTHREDGNFKNRINNHFGGNKNSSVFRKHLGGALIRKKNPNDMRLNQWLKQDAPTFQEIETEVSSVLKENFRFKCLPIEDRQERLSLEEQLITTLSRCPGCYPSENWLGHYAADELIQKSGLWNTQHVFGNNIITEESIKRIKEIVNGLNTRGERSLFLIPCCSEKISDGDNLTWKDVHLNQDLNRFQFLDSYRLLMINFYSTLSKEEAFDYYKNRGSGDEQKRKVENAWQKNLGILTCKTKKAIDRYNGNLYKTVNCNIKERLHNGDLKNVLIISALMGIIAPTDLIPDYELMMIDTSPKNRKVWEFWEETFATDDVKKKLRQLLSNFDNIYCLMSTTTGYADSVAKLLSGFKAYCIIPQEIGQTNKLKSWGKVLNDAILNKCNSPDKVRKVAEKHDCIMTELHVKSNNELTIKKHKIGGLKMGLTDEIRTYVFEKYIVPARKRGDKEITIRAGDIHKEMGLVSRMPAVCSALKSKIDKMYNIEIVRKDSPPSGYGANVYVTYKILNGSENDEEIKAELAQSKAEQVTIPPTPKLESKETTENIITTIRELDKLKNDGIITKEEFEKKKKELLDKL